MAIMVDAVERRWKWCVLVAVYTGIVVLCTTMYMGGILYVALLDTYPGHATKASLILVLNSALLGILGPVVTGISSRTSCRFSITVGAVLLTAAGFLSAFVTSLDHLLVTYGILGGIGNAMVGTPFAVVLGMYFKKRREFVLSLSMSVIAIGMVAAAPLVTILLETYALRGTFFIIAGLNSHLCIVGIICKPSPLELKIQSSSKAPSSDLDKTHSVNNRRNIHSSRLAKWVYFHAKQLECGVASNVPFMLFLTSCLTVYILSSVVALHIPNYAAIKGANAVQMAVVTTCFTASNVVGRFLAAALVGIGKTNNFWTHTILLGLIGILTLVFPFWDLFDLAENIFAAVVGLFTGAPCALMTPIVLELVGVEKIASAHGLEYLFTGSGQLIGPFIAALVYEQTGTYTYSFIFAGCAGLLGSFTALVAKHKIATRREQSSEKSNGIQTISAPTTQMLYCPKEHDESI